MKPSPTMPMLSIGSLRLQRANKLLRRSNVGEALLARLPLDAAIAGEADRFEHGEKLRPIHQPLPDRHFLAPTAGGQRAISVLDMALLDPRRQRAEGVDGIAHVVQDH